jgi:hypothetical protein
VLSSFIVPPAQTRERRKVSTSLFVFSTKREGGKLDWVSLNQSYHPAPLYSVKGVHDVVPVEYGQEMFNRPGDVARPFNIFPQDASSVLNGTN